eukprot:SAG11_NODE_632_length_8057_cov_6.472481_1_plen_277_part_00
MRVAATQDAVQRVETILSAAGPCANPADGGGPHVPIDPPPPPPPCDVASINFFCANDDAMMDPDPDVMCASHCARAKVSHFEACQRCATPAPEPAPVGLELGPRAAGRLHRYEPAFAAANADLVGLCTGGQKRRRCESQLADFEQTLRLACTCADPLANPDRSAGEADCRTGLPDRCSAGCAEVFTPFYSSCGAAVWGGASVPHQAFAEQCAVATGAAAPSTQCTGRACMSCSGDCGWCSAPPPPPGSGPAIGPNGICSALCTTTPGECAAAGGGH